MYSIDSSGGNPANALTQGMAKKQSAKSAKGAFDCRITGDCVPPDQSGGVAKKGPDIMGGIIGMLMQILEMLMAMLGMSKEDKADAPKPDFGKAASPGNRCCSAPAKAKAAAPSVAKAFSSDNDDSDSDAGGKGKGGMMGQIMGMLMSILKIIMQMLGSITGSSKPAPAPTSGPGQAPVATAAAPAPKSDDAGAADKSGGLMQGMLNIMQQMLQFMMGGAKKGKGGGD